MMTTTPTVTAASGIADYTSAAPPLHYLLSNNVRQTAQFHTLNWPQLLAMARDPFCLPKTQAPCFCPHSAPSKRLADILDHDQFGMLISDIDHGELSLDDVIECLTSIGATRFLVYSTASSTAAVPRWRVCIPLLETIGTDQWSDLVEYLNRLFNADQCTVKPTQVAFCPNSISGHYQHASADGAPLDANDTALPIVRAAIDCAAQRYRSELNRAAHLPKKTKVIDVPAGSINVIQALNDASDMLTLLVTYGYRRVGRRWVHPASQSKTPGVIITDDGRYVSHHSSDPLSDGHSHDCFDLVQQHDYGGDFGAALHAAGQLLTADGITLRKHNQIVFLKASNGCKQNG